MLISAASLAITIQSAAGKVNLFETMLNRDREPAMASERNCVSQRKGSERLRQESKGLTKRELLFTLSRLRLVSWVSIIDPKHSEYSLLLCPRS